MKLHPLLIAPVSLFLLLGCGILTVNAQPLQILPIDNTADLVKSIHRNDVWIVLAPTSTDTYDDPSLDGLYVLSPCNGGVLQERSAPCGQLDQGDNSILRACQTITDFCVLGAAGWIV